MSQPTVVLVHGAFADASSFATVIPGLLADGLRVVAPAVPNRSLVGDAEYVSAVLAAIDGPVVLVGHSYGCAVATVAGVAENIVALVYLAGFVPEEGESLGELQGYFPDSDLGQALEATPFQDTVELSVDVEKFPTVFAHDVDPAIAVVLAVSQRPLSAAVFGEKAPAAAWHSRPAWGVVAAADHTINPDVQRFAYRRAGIETVEVDSSHLVMFSQPALVTDLIRTVVRSVSG
ncbi:alpha/beta fold hydrolase [Parafrankia elaeagni]|uniref:alpha/beta fold hydrolase n=1 Tax=Parafrankia elaeagni TaxID=222534 RepID=UPI00035E5380|nr:alpha/beta hydrolase [Parafrankia elaeagni]